VSRRRRRDDPQEATTGRRARSARNTGNKGIWIVLLLLFALLAFPLLAVIGSILLVTPVRSSQSITEPPGAAVVVVEGQAPVALTATPLPALPPSGAMPADMPRSILPALSLAPDGVTLFVLLPGIAGLAVLVGAALIVGVGSWSKVGQTQTEHGRGDEEGAAPPARTAKLRLWILAFAFWCALSAFLILDLGFSVSLFPQFVIIYGAFWLLVGALLLTGRRMRDKLLILGLFVIILFFLRSVDWNSRKPFLRSLYRIEDGMSESQVEQIMNGYTKTYGGGPPTWDPEYREYEYDESGGLVTGWVTYRHTDEGWGDSDWGVVAFENGLVAGVEFLPD